MKNRHLGTRLKRAMVTLLTVALLVSDNAILYAAETGTVQTDAVVVSEQSISQENTETVSAGNAEKTVAVSFSSIIHMLQTTVIVYVSSPIVAHHGHILVPVHMVGAAVLVVRDQSTITLRLFFLVKLFRQTAGSNGISPGYGSAEAFLCVRTVSHIRTIPCAICGRFPFSD